jgi:hypothetical protein
MKLDVEENDYRRIEELIASDDSPVGIDAKRTHVLILDKLLKIEQRLERLERLAQGSNEAAGS